MGVSNNSVVLLITTVVLLITTPIIVTGEDEVESNSSIVIRPNCTDKCGNISIPYPFGIEDGCYYPYDTYHDNESALPIFKIRCNTYTNYNNPTSPAPIFGINFEVLSISVIDGELRSKPDFISYDCYNGHVNRTTISVGSFTLSSTKNILVAIGCDTKAWFTGSRGGRQYQTGCMTTCTDPDDLIDGECTGIGCCQASIPAGVNNVRVKVSSINNHSCVYKFNPCSVAYPVAKDAFTFKTKYLRDNTDYYDALDPPVVFNWTIGEDNCSVAKKNGSCLCKQNTVCVDPRHEKGYRCKCKQGYSGNPYLPLGCSDIDECKEENDCEKTEYCVNTNGSYYCKCPKGHHGNGTKSERCISNTKPWLIPVLDTAGVGGGIIILLLFGFLWHFKQKERQIKKMRQDYFQQNGGLLLHEKLSGREVDILKIFTMQDLKAACNNYSDENKIGRGGFGVVYKGILPNNQVVAIKKSLKVDPTQVEQFINEILVQSQINNRNVVKLLGCCLECEVPLLVYEFINNGTLYDHLHDPIKASNLKWRMRLKIASEVANVLSYLHHTISTPIFHRDVKSMNILLDESYTAKVTDFGASRFIPPDQVQFATIVLGTRGYLDPEYMQTGKLTEKSDVYSFGVVLLELLTSENAVSYIRPEAERNLSMHFLLKINEGRLIDILDINIVSEETIEEIQQMANLAKWCLMLKGEERPTMKEVAMELETISRKGSHPRNDDGLVQKDCEPFLADENPKLDHEGCSSGIESNSYGSQFISSLEIGR